MKAKNCIVFALTLVALAVGTNQTRAQRVYTPYAFTNFAGSRIGNTNGGGSAARFNFPEGVAVDTNGNVFVADSGNNTIRMITSGGMVTTIAGSPLDNLAPMMASGATRGSMSLGAWPWTAWEASMLGIPVTTRSGN